MALEDRDYARTSPPAGSRRPRSGFRGLGARGAMRGIPAHVVLIVVCCAVFLLEPFLGRVPVQYGSWEVAPGREQAFEDLRKSGIPTTTVLMEPGSNGVGTMFMMPGALPSQLAVDPIARAEYALVSPVRKWMQFTTAQAVVSIEPNGAWTGLEVWRFVGYGLLHVSLLHLAMNMLGLWWFGPIVEEAYGRRRFLAIFFLGVVAGALLFLLLNALGIAWVKTQGTQFMIPGLLFNDPYLPLVGASAGVYSVILAAAWLRPDDEVLLFFVIPTTLKWLALGIIGVSIYTLLQAGTNAGGEAAHLGGALAGWWVARRPHLLDDFFDFFGSGGPPRAPAARAARDAEVDRILDKVRASGLGSISARERETLRRASERRGGGADRT